jgi:hypothetical protein
MRRLFAMDRNDIVDHTVKSSPPLLGAANVLGALGSCRLLFASGFLMLLLFSGRCCAQGPLEFVHITFDGPPPQLPGTEFGVQQYFESGMWFRPIGPMDPGNRFGRHGGGIPTSPENGTAYLRTALGESLMFSFTNGTLFNLVSVDLAEYSTVVPDAVTVRFVGYQQDGAVVMTDLTTDGIIDGTGPLADFQTFLFDSRFTNLTRVEIPTYGWSLDNLVVAIPEPRTCALQLVGGLVFWTLYRFRLTSPRPACHGRDPLRAWKGCDRPRERPQFAALRRSVGSPMPPVE